MGAAVRRCALALAIVCSAAAPCWAGDQYALVVSGASGGEAYAKKYDGWRTSLAKTLKSFGYADDHIVAMAEASRDRIHDAMQSLRARLTKRQRGNLRVP